MPEEILPDDKWVNGYRSDLEVEVGMSRSTKRRKQENGPARTANHVSSANDGHSPHSPQRTSGGTQPSPENPW